jgi:hypothetical protein
MTRTKLRTLPTSGFHDHEGNTSTSPRGDHGIPAGHTTPRLVGKFVRRFALPTEIDASRLSAEFKEGVLNVHLPKSGDGKPKAISVKVGVDRLPVRALGLSRGPAPAPSHARLWPAESRDRGILTADRFEVRLDPQG